jgi:hypothetical protein
MFLSIRKSLVALTIAAASLTVSHAKAQYAPGDMSAIVQANMAFDQQFYAALPGLCWQAAIATRGQQLPFNAMTISRSVTELSNQYAANNANWYQNSNAQMNAVSNWSMGAIQGNWTYCSPSGGPSYVLPYTQNSYYQYNGYMYPGYMPGAMNYYPNP